ncbi:MULTISPECIES: glycosyltransferase [Actinomadura]|uniref:4,4'-diaponeurosporenoate glycosyltransferase n=1 Tax=Actinomadura yumaensis TaxID=111807 RepID=A0ABW2CC19_9ACTN|nr:glycosyltransferase [Actinomadura sp. J1-007]MWK33733.1 glycosyltransferase [Actinomadura sp. J1-007]
MVSIVVPAHDEARVIGRLLDGLLDGARPGEFEIVVVPNGCTDATAEVAARYPVRVVETAAASKAAALRAGDAAATRFPRLYVDADVQLGADGARALARALDEPGVLAVAPERDLELAGRPWAVRAYYRVWTRLPEVRRGLFGRGVVGVGAEGHRRLRALPPVIADDLAASQAFAPAERRVVASARVTVHPPRTWGDLLRRRVRAVRGTGELEASDAAQAAGSARTGTRDLLAMARRDPRLVPSLAVFAAVAVIARRRARTAGTGQWERDESSRT